MEPDKILERLVAAENRSSRPAHGDKAEEHCVDHWCSPVLLERAAYLRKLARAGEGSASETLREYPGHAMMLSVRLRSGVAEFHARFADLFIVLEGHATLVSGGTIIDSREEAPGEIRGCMIEGGARRDLCAGDVVHIPAATPHQLLLSGEQGFASLVMKMEHELPHRSVVAG